MKIYLVGGAVRDSLLNLPIKDRDWVIIGATPEQLLQQGYTQVGKDFPVFLHPTTHEEYALARQEHKTGKGYNGFTCDFSPTVTLEQDLARRDLTINAIAQDADGNFIDPFHGIQDLHAGILRHVSPAFAEDPLRVLRVARFAARYHEHHFKIASQTLALMKSLKDELSTLTPERVWLETEKALVTNDPQYYFQILRDCDALGVLFPEIEQLFGVPAPERWHPEIDTGIHTLLTLKQAARLTKDPAIRFAALCHDLGKGITPKEKWPHHHGHGRAGIPIVQALCQRLRVPNTYRDLAIIICEYHDLIHKVTLFHPSSFLAIFDHIDVWRKPERLEALLSVSQADYTGRLGWHDRPYPQAQYVREAFYVVSKVSVTPIVAAGFKGSDIREELHRRRLALLTEWCQTQHHHLPSTNACPAQ